MKPYYRNLYAMRVTKIVLSRFGVVACLLAVLRNMHLSTTQSYPWACLAVEILFLIWWLWGINANWVKVPAFAYAERLLESMENLPQSNKSVSDKTGG